MLSDEKFFMLPTSIVAILNSLHQTFSLPFRDEVELFFTKNFHASFMEFLKEAFL